MNFSYLLMVLASVSMLSLSACEKTTGERVTDKVGDALDSRPHEKAKDAAEDMSDAAKDAGNAIKDEARSVRDKAKDATN